MNGPRSLMRTLRDFPFFEVGHLDEAGKWECLVGSGEVPRHDLLAKGGGAALQAKPRGLIIPRAAPRFLVIECFFHFHGLVVAAPDGVGAFLVAVVATGAREA